MPIVVKNIIPPKSIENTLSTQYVANGVTTIIDKFTSTNFSADRVTVNVYLVAPGEIPANASIMVKNRMLQPNETYTFPEIVGQVLPPGGYLSTSASASVAVNIYASGREIS